MLDANPLINEASRLRIDKEATYKLLHGTTVLGTISSLYGDQPEIGGDYTPSSNATEYRRFFDHCTDDGRDFPDLGGDYPDDYFDNTLWYIEHPTDGLIPIWLPAVFWSDGEISFRWRRAKNNSE